MVASTWSPSPLILSCISETAYLTHRFVHHASPHLDAISAIYILRFITIFFSLDSPSHCISLSFDLFFSATPMCPTILSLLFLIAIEFPSRCLSRSMAFKISISVSVEALPFAATACNTPSKGPSNLYHPHVLMTVMPLVHSFVLCFVSLRFFGPSRFVIYSRLNPLPNISVSEILVPFVHRHLMACPWLKKNIYFTFVLHEVFLLTVLLCHEMIVIIYSALQRVAPSVTDSRLVQ